jgi:hypothetical protein
MQRRFFLRILAIGVHPCEKELLNCLLVQTHASQMERSVTIFESASVLVYLLFLF